MVTLCQNSFFGDVVERNEIIFVFSHTFFQDRKILKHLKMKRRKKNVNQDLLRDGKRKICKILIEQCNINFSRKWFLRNFDHQVQPKSIEIIFFSFIVLSFFKHANFYHCKKVSIFIFALFSYEQYIIWMLNFSEILCNKEIIKNHALLCEKVP